MAKNDARLTVRRRLLWTTYDYEERFRDVVTRATAVEAITKLYPAMVEVYADEVQRRLPDHLTSGQVRQAVFKELDPVIHEVVEGITAHGQAYFANEQRQQEVEHLFEKDRIVATIVKSLPPPAGGDAAAWQKAQFCWNSFSPRCSAAVRSARTGTRSCSR
jgi:hypothetical protein